MCSSSTRSRARAPIAAAAPGSSSSAWYASSAAVGVVDDDELLARLEPALEPAVRIRDDRGAGRGELERAARRRPVDGGVRSPRDVEVDPRSRDRPGEDVERHVAERAGGADVSLEVTSAEREVDPRIASRGLAHERLHPLAPELVAVAVEEDVVLLLDRERPEELRIRRPEDGLGATRAELEQPGEPALGVREHEVVLGRIGAVVVVEARVHAAELRQAHRHVAVVEDDRDAVTLAQVRRDAAEVRHRHGEDEDCVGPLSLDEPIEVAAPARRHDLPDRLAGELVERALVGAVLGPAEVPVALEARQAAAQRRVALPLAVRRDSDAVRHQGDSTGRPR